MSQPRVEGRKITEFCKQTGQTGLSEVLLLPSFAVLSPRAHARSVVQLARTCRQESLSSCHRPSFTPRLATKHRSKTRRTFPFFPLHAQQLTTTWYLRRLAQHNRTNKALEQRHPSPPPPLSSKAISTLSEPRKCQYLFSSSSSSWGPYRKGRPVYAD